MIKSEIISSIKEKEMKMAPNYMDRRNFTSSDLEFMRHIANNPDKLDKNCSCGNLQVFPGILSITSLSKTILSIMFFL